MPPSYAFPSQVTRVLSRDAPTTWRYALALKYEEWEFDERFAVLNNARRNIKVVSRKLTLLQGCQQLISTMSRLHASRLRRRLSCIRKLVLVLTLCRVLTDHQRAP